MGILFVLSLCFASCNWGKRDKAIKLSDDLTSINDSINYYGKKWTEELQIAVNTKDFSHLKSVRTEITDFIDHKIKYVESLKDIAGSENFRQSEIDILRYQKDTVMAASAVFENFTETTTDEDITAAYQNLMATTKDELIRLERVYKLRDEYADKNDIPKPVDK